MTGKTENRVTKSQEKNALKCPDLKDRPVWGIHLHLQDVPAATQPVTHSVWFPAGRFPTPKGQHWEHFTC